MSDFRDHQYLERYEYISVELDTPIRPPANTQNQRTTGYHFTIDNTAESNPFDWYNAFIKVDFQVQKLADGAANDAVDNLSTVNSISSFLKKVSVNLNGVITRYKSLLLH